MTAEEKLKERDKIKKGTVECLLGYKPLCMDKLLNYYCEKWDRVGLKCKGNRPNS